MKRERLIAVGLAIVIAGLAGCATAEETRGDRGGDGGSESPPPPESPSETTTTTPPVAPGSAKVKVDGKESNITGPVVCETNAGQFSIAIGEPLTGMIIGLEQDGSAVHGVGLGEVDGVLLSATEGAAGNEAKATKEGNNYKITGTATGLDPEGEKVSKSFEIDVTCP